LASADSLAPHHSLDRADKAAATVTTAVSIAGTLVAGFGTIAATELADTGIGWAAPAVILAAVSVACAILASVPGASTVAPGNLATVEAFFRSEVRRRGRLVRVAAWTLAAAVCLAPAPVVAAALTQRAAALDLSAHVSSADSYVIVQLKASGLNKHARVQLSARNAHRSLATAAADAGPDGAAAASFSLGQLPSGTRVSIVASSDRPRRTNAMAIVVPG
jgi:hypothetical protein